MCLNNVSTASRVRSISSSSTYPDLEPARSLPSTYLAMSSAGRFRREFTNDSNASLSAFEKSSRLPPNASDTIRSNDSFTSSKFCTMSLSFSSSCTIAAPTRFALAANASRSLSTLSTRAHSAWSRRKSSILFSAQSASKPLSNTPMTCVSTRFCSTHRVSVRRVDASKYVDALSSSSASRASQCVKKPAASELCAARVPSAR
mmetsp:Transcript_14135/g.50792  ORF Transcript_14135/g.50792 Transcript_14135/m.50792 type:complete len:203 (-) Transcript_14135:233-841(-)